MFSKRNDVIIDELKRQRKEAISNLNNLCLIKNEELGEVFYSKFQTGEDVPFKLLMEMPENEAIPLPVVHGGWIITTRKSMTNPNVVLYETKWSAGSTLTWHYHSDCNEKIVVKKGRIKVYSEGNVNVLVAGQTIEIFKGVGHQVTALEDTELDIKFFKVNVQ
tara:strand:+ start:173 stop:661 length:489 start_codon:yes stop_codon:yes gene_type:complete